jgi:hypothetical protein
MKLEHINILLRPRTPWEAIDLGRIMMIAWHKDVWKAWSITYLAFGIFLLLVLWKHQAIALTLIWWLKPFSDRALLFAMSRSLFGTPTTFGDVWRSLPGLFRNTGLISALTFRRFSMRRSLLIPVWQLEGQTGRTASQRCNVLAARIHNPAVWLTTFCANMSLFLMVSLIIFINLLVPQGHEGIFNINDLVAGTLSPGNHFVLGSIYMVAESIVEPFYLASGFALYLNRRSEIEGWDIELAFRQMSVRKAGE